MNEKLAEEYEPEIETPIELAQACVDCMVWQYKEEMLVDYTDRLWQVIHAINKIPIRKDTLHDVKSSDEALNKLSKRCLEAHRQGWNMRDVTLNFRDRRIIKEEWSAADLAAHGEQYDGPHGRVV